MSKKLLRWYQKEAVDAIVKSWHRGEVPYCNCCPGSGKSLMLAELSERCLKQGGRVIQLVPKLEHVNQNYREMFNHSNHKNDIGICCSKLQKFQTSRKCVIATSSSFLRRRATSGAFNVCLIDECFTGDTLISTPNGMKQIKLVNSGDMIYNAIGVGFVEKIMIKPSNEIYILEFDNGNRIECTGNHPFFTTKGWEKARDLEIGRDFFSKEGLSLLWERVLTDKKNRKWSSNKIYNTKKMGRPEMLLEILLEEINESNEGRISKKKSKVIIDKIRTQTYKSRWERPITITSSIGIASCFRGWMESRIINKNICRSQEWNISELLQSRYRESRLKNSYRNTRLESWHNRKTDIRYKKERETCFPRLVSISIEQRESITPVYNISVSGHPSYFANGILVHNCHNVPNDLESGYRKIITSLLRQNPRMLIAGVSGTPYRMSQGMMHESCIKGPALFTHQVYETPIPKMIEEGFLCHIESISGDVEIDVTGLKMSGQDYDTSAMAVKFEQICEDAVKDAKLKIDLYDIQTGIIFVSNVSNAEHVKNLWGNDEIRVLHGGISDSERKTIIKWLETGSGRRFVVNPNILTEGYDFPELDLVVLMRATASLRLYVQMTTRAIRAHSEKERGYILDYGQNIDRHGPIDATIPPKGKKKKGEAPSKPCTIILDKTIIDKDDGSKHLKGTQCFKSNLLSAKFCRLCGAEFIPENEEGKYSMRSKADILQMKINAETYTYEIANVYYEKSYSRKDNTPMIKARFYDEDVNHIHDSYLTLNHSGFARDNAIKMLISMLKNPSDYSDIAQFEGGINVDNVLLLLENEEYKERYFKRVKSITLAPSIKTKFKELKSISYF
jgi:superfamily II DNA or RNA helicase